MLPAAPGGFQRPGKFGNRSPNATFIESRETQHDPMEVRAIESEPVDAHTFNVACGGCRLSLA